MTRIAWSLILIAFAAPFFGVAWMTGLGRLAEVLAGAPSLALLRAFQVVGAVLGLLISAASIYAARAALREME